MTIPASLWEKAEPVGPQQLLDYLMQKRKSKFAPVIETGEVQALIDEFGYPGMDSQKPNAAGNLPPPPRPTPTSGFWSGGGNFYKGAHFGRGKGKDGKGGKPGGKDGKKGKKGGKDGKSEGKSNF